MTGDFYVVIDGDIRENRWSLDNWGTFRRYQNARDRAEQNATPARPLAVLTIDDKGTIQNRHNFPTPKEENQR